MQRYRAFPVRIYPVRPPAISVTAGRWIHVQEMFRATAPAPVQVRSTAELMAGIFPLVNTLAAPMDILEAEVQHTQCLRRAMAREAEASEAAADAVVVKPTLAVAAPAIVPVAEATKVEVEAIAAVVEAAVAVAGTAAAGEAIVSGGTYFSTRSRNA